MYCNIYISLGFEVSRMIKFVIKKTGELKEAFSAKENNEKIHIKFSENGKEYAYNKDKIEILLDTNTQKIEENKLPFKVYTFKKQCHKCHQYTDVITYIKFDDGSYEDLDYPWDQFRLFKIQNAFAHLLDPSIEYYGILVLGDCKEYDEMLLNAFPDRIFLKYSATTENSYAMNICSHCGTHQGHYFLYRQINEMIQSMYPIDEIDDLPITLFDNNVVR